MARAAPVRAAASASAGASGESSRRQALSLGVGAAAAALLPTAPALALSGFTAIQDTRDGYQFYYPVVGWCRLNRWNLW